MDEETVALPPPKVKVQPEHKAIRVQKVNARHASTTSHAATTAHNSAAKARTAINTRINLNSAKLIAHLAHRMANSALPSVAAATVLDNLVIANAVAVVTKTSHPPDAHLGTQLGHARGNAHGAAEMAASQTPCAPAWTAWLIAVVAVASAAAEAASAAAATEVEAAADLVAAMAAK